MFVTAVFFLQRFFRYRNKEVFILLDLYLTAFRKISTRVLSVFILGAAIYAQTPTPVPTPTRVAPSPTPATVRTLEDLQAEIRSRLFRPELNRGQIGIKIVSLGTGKIWFEQNSEKYFMPASNMKNFTVATALEKLTPDFRFVTSVYAAAMPDSSGRIAGDLRVYGRGDISISTAFADAFPNTLVQTPMPTPSASPTAAEQPSDQDAVYYKGIDRLIDRIAAAGVKRIEGSIIGDDSYFKGYPIPEGWEWDDLQSYFGAGISALSINDNAVDLLVIPGTVGSACKVKLSPYNTVYRIKNTCVTTAAGSPRTLGVHKVLGQDLLEITGTLPAGNAGFKNSVAVSRPAELFAALLKQRLQQRGITVVGGYRTSVPMSNTAPPEAVEIAKLESAPLTVIAAKTMKPSQNMYTETLLWTIGEQTRKVILIPAGSPQPDSSALGRTEVKNFLRSIGVADDGIIQYDGSGLSRHNLITPSAVVQLYTYMAKQSKFAQAWRDSLTIGGVDGTLANRFKGTLAQGNIRGKTGTIDQVSALSGYITTAGGEQLVVSFVVNGVAVTRDRTSLIDDIVVMLAQFNGRVE